MGEETVEAVSLTLTTITGTKPIIITAQKARTVSNRTKSTKPEHGTWEKPRPHTKESNSSKNSKTTGHSLKPTTMKKPMARQQTGTRTLTNVESSMIKENEVNSHKIFRFLLKMIFYLIYI
jgi:hypothetical protein